jgi:MFS family permease
MPSFSSAFFPGSVPPPPNPGAPPPPGAPASSYCLFSDQLLSLGGSIIYIAALPAVAAASRLTQKYGRKPTMWAIAAAAAGGAAVGAGAQNLAAVLASRALLGAAMGCRCALSGRLPACNAGCYR